jgi:hypothetical protein
MTWQFPHPPRLITATTSRGAAEGRAFFGSSFAVVVLRTTATPTTRIARTNPIGHSRRDAGGMETSVDVAG